MNTLDRIQYAREMLWISGILRRMARRTLDEGDCNLADAYSEWVIRCIHDIEIAQNAESGMIDPPPIIPCQRPRAVKRR